MRNRTAFIHAIILSAIVSTIVYFGVTIWRSTRDTAYLSCVSSLTDKVLSQEKAQLWMAENKDWKILSEEEIDLLMANVKGSDCSGIGDTRYDFWNKRINIALRTRTDKDFGIVIWSDGRDGLPATGDELVAPYGHEVP
jgi:hypothetical protein